ncbi:MAG: response regulator, partial [Elusimicrobiota bacterium]|nr:response regulator [Elusimicrobiota bacterium]
KAALWKLSEGIFSFKEVYERILAEEISSYSAFKKVPPPKLEIAPARRKEDIKSKPAAPVQAGGEKILVVDDDGDLLALAEKILNNAGYKTDTASDGVEAIIKISKNSYNLVLSDIDMPNLDGIQLVEMINQKNLNTKIIMLTASSDENAESRSLTVGALDFIRKPFKKDILLLRIKKALKS